LIIVVSVLLLIIVLSVLLLIIVVSVLLQLTASGYPYVPSNFLNCNAAPIIHISVLLDLPTGFFLNMLHDFLYIQHTK
jgi:hypothetical protein